MFNIFKKKKLSREILVSEKNETIQNALNKVFLVTSWGYGADHWFSWFSKALNAHPEVFSYLANEGSRPKYFPEERTRADRPNIIKFVRFIADVGLTFESIGDCYSYRPTMLNELLNIYPDIPVLHLTRHPYAWLFFHVRWRERNMRMLGGENKPIDHEWEKGCDHELFKSLKLRSYNKEDIEIWTTYQGFWKMNDVVSDIKVPIRQIAIERLIHSPSLFLDQIKYLTHGKVKYSDELIKIIYSWIWKPFDGEEKLRIKPDEYRKSWPDWKIEAFEKIVSQEAKNAFNKIGYNL
tara:strand:- start:674 stop:1555 length:882 start_codon:yes stop_codon:yes gene_type:complete